MISMISYLHRCCIRSYRYVAPTIVFVAVLLIMYSVVPNPVMSSYSFSTAFLFVISVIICYSLIDMETLNQESITLIHSKSIIKLYIAKLLYSWLVTIPLAIFAVSYPALTNKFHHIPTGEEWIFALTYHLFSAWLAVTLTGWFSKKFLRSRLISFLLLSLLVVICLSGQGLIEQLPSSLKWMMYILPPLHMVIDVQINFDLSSIWYKLSSVLSTLVYSLISLSLYLYTINKKKLDLR